MPILQCQHCGQRIEIGEVPAPAKCPTCHAEITVPGLGVGRPPVSPPAVVGRSAPPDPRPLLLPVKPTLIPPGVVPPRPLKAPQPSPYLDSSPSGSQKSGCNVLGIFIALIIVIFIAGYNNYASGIATSAKSLEGLLTVRFLTGVAVTAAGYAIIALLPTFLMSIFLLIFRQSFSRSWYVLYPLLMILTALFMALGSAYARGF